MLDVLSADETIFDGIANEVLNCIPEAENYWDKNEIEGLKLVDVHYI